MRAIACVVICVAACSYSEPRLDGTRFRCDATTGCPSGQKCAGSVCVAASHDGIACTTPCTPDQQCCDDGTNPPRCIGATEDCIGRGAFCDGKEDCPAGQLCCALGVDQTCEADCIAAACLQPADCPSNAPNCCAASDPLPWKLCQIDPC